MALFHHLVWIGPFEPDQPVKMEPLYAFKLI